MVDLNFDEPEDVEEQLTLEANNETEDVSADIEAAPPVIAEPVIIAEKDQSIPEEIATDEDIEREELRLKLLNEDSDV